MVRYHAYFITCSHIYLLKIYLCNSYCQVFLSEWHCLYCCQLRCKLWGPWRYVIKYVRVHLHAVQYYLVLPYIRCRHNLPTVVQWAHPCSTWIYFVIFVFLVWEKRIRLIWKETHHKQDDDEDNDDSKRLLMFHVWSLIVIVSLVHKSKPWSWYSCSIFPVFSLFFCAIY